MDRGDWTAFLREYNGELLASRHIAEALQYAEGDDLRRAVDAGWLGYRGASVEQLARVEARLGVTLPPDYRDFLWASNGWRWPGTLVPRLWPAEELEWYRVTDAETIDIWSRENPQLGRELRGALRVSDQEIAGTAVYLLVPQTDDSGWEAWIFAHWIPGEERYDSFRALLESERESFREQEAHAAKRPLPSESAEQLAAKLPNLVNELRGKADMYRALPDPLGVGNVANARTAAALQEVADRVQSLQARTMSPGDLREALRALRQEVEAERLAINQRWGQRSGPLTFLLLVPGALAMARGEGLRQAAALITWFLDDART